jgi:hypothetical protein
MNHIRLGMTESTLLFFWYLTQKKVNPNLYIAKQYSLINWLYSTSGFYDKQIIGSYFNFDASSIKQTKVYNDYFRYLLKFLISNNNFKLELIFHNFNHELLGLKEEFLNYIGYYTKNMHSTNLNHFMQDKNILIINNLGSLMKKQFESGNIHKINPNFPDNVKSIQYIENGYTFLNNGPDSSIFETTKKLYNKIEKYDFDGVIISAGAYSWLIADFVLNKLNKPVFIIGGLLPLYFGIITQRIIQSDSDKINKYFIEVPAEMRPLNYKKIENGCYW